MFAVAAMLGGIAALLAGLTLMGVALLLGPVTACWELSPVYRPELPRRLVAWLTKRNDLPLTADRDDRD